MATASELKSISDDRLREAELLHVNGFHSGAYYLSGYAVEFGLEAAICKRLNIEMFERKIVPGEVAKAFQIHDIKYLIILAGLHQDLEDFKSVDVAFVKAWSLVSEWNEQRRYDYGCKPLTPIYNRVVRHRDEPEVSGQFVQL